MAYYAITKALVGTETARNIRVFLYLQILDFLTTWIGLRMGHVEASPFIRLLMQFGPVAGLAASKLCALGLVGLSILLDKAHILRWINYWFAALIVWNLFVISLPST